MSLAFSMVSIAASETSKAVPRTELGRKTIRILSDNEMKKVYEARESGSKISKVVPVPIGDSLYTPPMCGNDLSCDR